MLCASGPLEARLWISAAPAGAVVPAVHRMMNTRNHTQPQARGSELYAKPATRGQSSADARARNWAQGKVRRRHRGHSGSWQSTRPAAEAGHAKARALSATPTARPPLVRTSNSSPVTLREAAGVSPEGQLEQLDAGLALSFRATAIGDVCIGTGTILAVVSSSLLTCAGGPASSARVQGCRGLNCGWRRVVRARG